MRTPDASTATFWTLPRAVGAAGAAHALAWSVLPPLYLGNLHTDTVEALSWASHWDWGYFKHPPLVVWLFKAALALPGPRLVNFLIISQLSVLISAALIWQNVRALKDAEAAAAAVCLYLASPPATYFAVQINHNSLSIPFDAAILCFGILFLEKRRTRDIAVLGVVVGFALLTKYQTAFFPMTLAILAVANPKYRWVWSDWRGYAAALLALLIFAPHVWWDFNHGWRTLLYASSDRPLRGWVDIGLSLNELFDGMLMAAVGPIFCWFIMGRPRLTKSNPAEFRLGVGIAATPIVIMIFLGFLSGQVLRQGWLIPLIPSVEDHAQGPGSLHADTEPDIRLIDDALVETAAASFRFANVSQSGGGSIAMRRIRRRDSDTGGHCRERLPRRSRIEERFGLRHKHTGYWREHLVVQNLST